MRSNHMGSDARFWMWTSRKTFVRSSADSNAEGERGIWTFVLTDNGFVTYAKRTSKPPPSSANGRYGWSKKGKGGVEGLKIEGDIRQICKTCGRSATHCRPLYPRQEHRSSLPRLPASARQVGAGTRQCRPVRAGGVP